MGDYLGGLSAEERRRNLPMIFAVLARKVEASRKQVEPV